jgi:hypothetical protein
MTTGKRIALYQPKRISIIALKLRIFFYFWENTIIQVGVNKYNREQIISNVVFQHKYTKSLTTVFDILICKRKNPNLFISDVSYQALEYKIKNKLGYLAHTVFFNKMLEPIDPMGKPAAFIKMPNETK